MLNKINRKLKKILWSFYSKEKRAILSGVDLGSNNFIASEFWSSEPFLIKVGSNCQITDGVKFFTHGGGGAVRKYHPKFDCFGKIVVGDYVYIGTNALIMPGVTIGDNVLIAAGSVVTSSLPPNVVVGGNPARIICSLEQYIDRNMAYNLDTKGLSDSEKKKILLSTDEAKFIHKRELTLTEKK